MNALHPGKSLAMLCKRHCSAHTIPCCTGTYPPLISTRKISMNVKRWNMIRWSTLNPNPFCSLSFDCMLLEPIPVVKAKCSWQRKSFPLLPLRRKPIRAREVVAAIATWKKWMSNRLLWVLVGISATSTLGSYNAGKAQWKKISFLFKYPWKYIATRQECAGTAMIKSSLRDKECASAATDPSKSDIGRNRLNEKWLYVYISFMNYRWALLKGSLFLAWAE